MGDRKTGEVESPSFAGLLFLLTGGPFTGNGGGIVVEGFVLFVIIEEFKVGGGFEGTGGGPKGGGFD